MEKKTPLIIYDAIHQVMEFPSHFAPLLLDLIQLPSVQRLRRIKQQSLCDLVFPTATHTRLSHALGTAFLSWRMLRHIKKQGFLDTFDEQDVNTLLAAAFLHDIGHGPFSHTFEIFLKNLGLPLLHEEWTESILSSESFSSLFLKYGLGERLKLISNIITKKGSARKEALKKESPHWFLASDIISSQLDADRLDYLLRDSHFCGVTYGHFDLNWLLNCLTSIDQGHGPRLGILKQGIGSLEHFLVARRLMYQNIYSYPKIVAFDRLIVAFLIELVQLIEPYKKDLEPFLGHFLSSFLQKIPKNSSKKKFQKEAFESFLMLSDDDIWNAVRNIYHFLPKKLAFKKVLELSYKLHFHKTPKVFRIKKGPFNVQNLREELQLKKEDYWKCDGVELSVSLYSTVEDPILVQKESAQETIRTITFHSELIRQLSDRIEPSYYLLVDQDLMDQHREKIETFLNAR